MRFLHFQRIIFQSAVADSNLLFLIGTWRNGPKLARVSVAGVNPRGCAALILQELAKSQQLSVQQLSKYM